MLLSLVVIGAFVLYVMNSDERDGLRRRLLSLQVTVIRVSANTLEAGAVLVRAFRARQFWARTAAAALMMIALASVAGWTLIRPPLDIKGEIDNLVATEASTTAAYDTAVAQFRLGTMTAAALGAGDRSPDQARAARGQHADAVTRKRAARAAGHAREGEGIPAPARRDLAAAGGRAAEARHGGAPSCRDQRTRIARGARGSCSGSRGNVAAKSSPASRPQVFSRTRDPARTAALPHPPIPVLRDERVVRQVRVAGEHAIDLRHLARDSAPRADRGTTGRRAAPGGAAPRGCRECIRRNRARDRTTRR